MGFVESFINTSSVQVQVAVPSLSQSVVKSLKFCCCCVFGCSNSANQTVMCEGVQVFFQVFYPAPSFSIISLRSQQLCHQAPPRAAGRRIEARVQRVAARKRGRPAARPEERVVPARARAAVAAVPIARRRGHVQFGVAAAVADAGVVRGCGARGCCCCQVWC